ncbi:acyltransferase family protein [Sphingosinicella sp. BN140058]|uniref:acyltransferase family protein n=1 Tax=Sphingosinicella sp. BN140058 TaxID=1892855 RepID=UPI0010121EF2|nr:acyltransferase family protein [Sphingosinicella sp. BN140058]QAY75328.1 acyltransferase [Sphingosinicella sp. BN140058]
MNGNAAKKDRRLDLDWIRIGAFGLLILYHIGMYYVPWDWHVKSPRTIDWLQPIMVLTNPWRLTLLFIVSGAATRFMLDGAATPAFLRTRLLRLVPPLLFGMLVIVPPQTWLQLADAGTQLPYLRFYAAYLTASGNWRWHDAPLTTPTWNHLWFVVYILAYTILLAGAAALVRRLPARALALIGQRVARIPLWIGLALLPVVTFTAIRLILAPHFPETHAFFGDWTVHAESLAAFLFGFGAARSDRIWSALAAWRHTTLLVAIAAYAVYAGALILWMSGAIDPALAKAVMRSVYGLDQWSWTAAMLGYAHHHLARLDHPARRYLTQAIFPWYLVHQTLIIGTAWMLRPIALPLALEATMILAATIGGCALFFALVRRTNWLRVLTGLKPVDRSPRGSCGPEHPSETAW